MTDRTLNQKMKQLEKLEAEKKALEKEIEKLKESVQKEMGEETELTTGSWIIRWTVVVQNRLDSKALRADMPELYNKYCRESESRRFSYSAK